MRMLTPEGDQISSIARSDGTVIENLDPSILDDMDNANLDNTMLSGIEIDGLICAGATFRHANLENANLYWINAIDAIFDGANLRRASLRGGNLSGASFVGSDLTDADFSEDNVGGETSLQRANLDGAIILRTNFHGATYDRSTVFPQDFDPKMHAMQLVEGD